MSASYREELVERVIAMWETYMAEYNTIVDEYEKLLKQMRDARPKFKAIRPIRREELAHFPMIKTLGKETRDELIGCIARMSLDELIREIESIEEYRTSYIRNTLLSRTFDFRYRLSHRDSYKPSCGAYDDSYVRKASIPTAGKTLIRRRDE